MYKKDYMWLWLFVLLLSFILAIAFNIVFVEHPINGDDTVYMRIAQNLSPNGFANPTQKNFRIGLLFPLKILIKIFGYSIFTYYLFSIGFSVLLLLAVLLLTKKLFGLRVAFISTILMLPSYIISYQSTNILPDIPAFFGAVFSLYLFLIYLDNINKRYILLASVVFGFITYITKLPVTIFLITLPLLEYIKTKSIHKTIKYAAIFTVFIICEMITYY
ncbi:MAG: glycosyltransferase family 39 protein, partial [Ignavibacteriaceae bacterium]